MGSWSSLDVAAWFKGLDMIHDAIVVSRAGEHPCYANLNGATSLISWCNMTCGWQDGALLQHFKYCSFLQREFRAECAAGDGLLSVAPGCSYAMVRVFQHTLYCSSSQVACVVWQRSQRRCRFVQHLLWRRISGQEAKKMSRQYET